MYISPLFKPEGKNPPPHYIDIFTRIYDENKKPVKCKICNNQLEYAPETVGIHCIDNLLHKQEQL